jgi:hypothetical protein
LETAASFHDLIEKVPPGTIFALDDPEGSARGGRVLTAAAANLDHFGTKPGSPRGVPDGGITGITPPPVGSAEMPGSMPAGGQITPFERACSTRRRSKQRRRA